MPLTCSCEFFGEYAWYFDAPSDYSTLDTPRRKRCRSCKTLIDLGATVTKFPRARYPLTEVEERIYGDDWWAVTLAPYYLCEECSDIYWSLIELGFTCVSPEDNMRSLAADYAENYGGARNAS